MYYKNKNKARFLHTVMSMVPIKTTDQNIKLNIIKHLCITSWYYFLNLGKTCKLITN